jgi:integrase
MNLVRVKFPYLMQDRDRHGNIRVYVRRHGRKVRIAEPMGSRGFARAYSKAMEALENPEVRTACNEFRAASPGTLGWLAAQYFCSRRFATLDAKSQSTRRLVIEECLREPPKPGAKSTMAACPIGRVTAAVVMMLMDRKAAKPGAANNRKKYLSALFGWAVKQLLMKANPARDAERIRYASDGFHTWTIDEVRQFEARHPVGTKARLALALLLFTGSRRGDVVTFGSEHTRNGVLRFVPAKTRYKRKTLSEKPIVPDLARIIAASPTGDLTFLVTEYGKSFTAAGFGAWFRKRCDEAGLPHCTAHGLRKAGATLAAEAGATDRQLMAMFDWTTASQATVYTAAADRKRLARDGARLMVGQLKKHVPPEHNSLIYNDDLDDWQEWRDSNPQPPVLETGALAIELHSYGRTIR